ncbi:tRNA lysidine(34) synthetase TilS [Niallia nealsonii]|uniref:tRNA(Ile)-lysidine synthase n=1 Tax=Niallia nealsonii TaxID=115979 RepID=A0A2N0YZ03_9BACI|nr:tRNA lysidine(34) synthetase TilS [Niallia nealsonii]PKG22490.1 tRNA lysidine(34) synthetase TilS [Niallia nealsonii]
MLELKVKKFLKKKGLTLEGSKVLVGVSGGPDSLALLHFLWTKQEEWNISIMAAHVDHMFRGEESLEEAKFVEEFCKEKSIPFVWKRIDVPKYIKETRANGQTASRDCRYSFFKEMIAIYNMDYLALGHHGDDQAETILMHLTRGSSGRARAGIPFERKFGKGILFRPFLCLERQEIENYCTINELNPRRDPSNDKEVYSRNRFRKHVMPFLKKENNRVIQHFQRFSEEIAEDELFLMELTVQTWNTVVMDKKENEIVIGINEFLSIANSLQRRCIQLILNYLYKDKPASLSALHIDQIIALLNSPHPSGNIDLPENLKVVKSYQLAYFQLNFSTEDPFYYEISKTGELLLPNGYYIKVEYIDKRPENLEADSILLCADSIKYPLIIRTRRNGDRIKLKGMAGTKKVNRIFVDEKIPIQQRATWPIVTDVENNLLWIPGLKKSIYSFSNKNSDCYLLITYKKQ